MYKFRSVEQDIINHFVKLVSVSPGDLQQYITRKLYSILSQDDDKIFEQEGLIIAGTWCIGEYGDMLIGNDVDQVLGGLLSEETNNNNNEEEEEGTAIDVKPSEDEVILLLNKLIDHFCNNDIICEYILTALAKLSTRLSSYSKEKCRSIVSKFVTNTDMEIQQRAVEYNEYMKLDETTLSSLMERIPPLEGASKLLASRKHNKSMDDSVDLLDDIDNNNANDLLGLSTSSSATTANQNQSDNIMDLLGGLSLGGKTTSTSTTKQMPSNTLDDLLGGISSSSSTQVPATSTKSNSVDLLGDLLGSSNTTNASNSTSSPINLMNSLTSPSLTSPTNSLSNNVPTRSNYFKYISFNSMKFYSLIKFNLI